MNHIDDPSSLAATIAACEREPIHIPGSIQPHGLLLIADEKLLTVTAGAGDLEARLAPQWLGATLDKLLGQDIGHALALAKSRRRAHFAIEAVAGIDELFGAVAHVAQGQILVELEPRADNPWTATRMLDELDRAESAFERAEDLPALAQVAAKAFRTLTGYDRVMVYRFVDNDAGVVIAEDCSDDIGSFLNHHFPASDIPKQARALYIRNRIRVIPNTDYAPAPIRPAGPATTTDLSDVTIRSVSPVHLQYLANMGVCASASMSIVKDNILWGLIACHNRTPLRISYDKRLACEKLASDLARQIVAKDNANNYRDRIRLRASEDHIVDRLRGDASLDGLFANTGMQLQKMLGADGFAAVQGRDIFVIGHCPDKEQLFALGGHFADKALAQPVATDHLESLFAPASEFRAKASGMIAVTMSTQEPTVMMWFRDEQIEHVNWAGNPHKAVVSGNQAQAESLILTPRASFEAWSEQVRGRSVRWTREEVEAAGRLKRAILDVRQNFQLRALNRELAATIAEKETLIEQKNYLMGEVNHRVQNSLQLVSSFLALQARDVDDRTLRANLKEAQRRISAVSLVHRRLYTDDRVEEVDLARYLDDLVVELVSSMDGGWADLVQTDLNPILVSTDRAINVGLILTELMINANKYAYDGAPGPISVALTRHRDRFQLIVADKGAGDLHTSEGYGTKMLRAMLRAIHGEMSRTDNQPGLRVVLTIPIERSKQSQRS